MCEARGLNVNLHAFMQSEISFLAHAQVAATIPNLTLGNQVMHQLLAERLTIGVDVATRGGTYRLGDAPGPRLRDRPDAVARAHERWQRDGPYNTIESRAAGVSTIVVGGGIMGAATLCELARAGEDALLLEAGTFGESVDGQVGRDRALPLLEPRGRADGACAPRAAFTSMQPYYTRCGWLFLVDEADAEPARRNREMQLREGRSSDEVDDLQELRRRRAEGVAYALYEPDSGFADPVAATRAYIDAARREGAEAREASPVEAIEPGRGVRVGGRAARGGQRRARGGAVVEEARRTGSGSSCRSRSRASRTSSSTTGGAPSAARDLVAGRPRLHAPDRRRATPRRPRLPEGLRARRSRRATTRRSTTRSRRTCGRACRRRLPGLNGHAARSAAGSACTR